MADIDDDEEVIRRALEVLDAYVDPDTDAGVLARKQYVDRHIGFLARAVLQRLGRPYTQADARRALAYVGIPEYMGITMDQYIERLKLPPEGDPGLRRTRMALISREEAEALTRSLLDGGFLPGKTAHHAGRYEIVHVLDAIYGAEPDAEGNLTAIRYLGHFDESFTERRHIDLWFDVEGILEVRLGDHPHFRVRRGDEDVCYLAVWRAMCGLEREPELENFTDEDFTRLRGFARKAGGWIHYAGGWKFIPMAEWVQLAGADLPTEG